MDRIVRLFRPLRLTWIRLIRIVVFHQAHSDQAKALAAHGNFQSLFQDRNLHPAHQCPHRRHRDGADAAFSQACWLYLQPSRRRLGNLNLRW